MKILSINLGNTGSTGAIARNIAKTAKNNGIETIQAYAGDINDNTDVRSDILICSEFMRLINRTLTYLTGLEGSFSLLGTVKLIKVISNEKPDIIHFHNLHGWYINIPMLFRYIKRHKIRVIWTLHDCWAFTGHCPHFQKTKCEKWKTGCYSCQQYLDYPKSYYDNSKHMYKLKKKHFTSLDNMVVVTPSQWLAKLVSCSFLKNYALYVINNGIDLSVFCPMESEFRTIYGCQDKFVIIGVSSVWSYSKGLDVFIELAKQLDDSFQIVIVGTTDDIDRQLPSNIISVHRTKSQHELAKLYSAADIFLNPTREDTFPTVNIESLACGTPVLTFRTGGSPEIIDEECGRVVELNDIYGLIQEINNMRYKPLSSEACLKRAKYFDMQAKFDEYIELYKSEANI